MGLRRSFLLCCVGAVAASPVGAQERWAWYGDVAATSDYDDRGLSLSDKDPSAIVGVEAVRGTLSRPGGEWFVGALAGRVDTPANSDVQVTGYGGWARRLGGAYDVSLTVYGETFHGAGSQAFVEGRAAVARDFGLFYVRGGVGVAPDGRWSDRNRTVVYPFAEAQVPVPRLPWLTVTANLGYSAVSQTRDRADWSVGLAAGRGDFEFTLRYVDSESRRRIGDARAVAMLRYYF